MKHHVFYDVTTALLFTYLSHSCHKLVYCIYKILQSVKGKLNSMTKDISVLG